MIAGTRCSICCKSKSKVGMRSLSFHLPDSKVFKIASAFLKFCLPFPALLLLDLRPNKYIMSQWKTETRRGHCQRISHKQPFRKQSLTTYIAINSSLLKLRPSALVAYTASMGTMLRGGLPIPSSAGHTSTLLTLI